MSDRLPTRGDKLGAAFAGILLMVSLHLLDGSSDDGRGEERCQHILDLVETYGRMSGSGTGDEQEDGDDDEDEDSDDGECPAACVFLAPLVTSCVGRRLLHVSRVFVLAFVALPKACHAAIHAHTFPEGRGCVCRASLRTIYVYVYIYYLFISHRDRPLLALTGVMSGTVRVCMYRVRQVTLTIVNHRASSVSEGHSPYRVLCLYLFFFKLWSSRAGGLVPRPQRRTVS